MLIAFMDGVDSDDVHIVSEVDFLRLQRPAAKHDYLKHRKSLVCEAIEIIAAKAWFFHVAGLRIDGVPSVGKAFNCFFL